MTRRVSKTEWYQAGGFANPRCWRKHAKTHWRYYINDDD